MPRDIRGQLSAEGRRFAVIVSRFNESITSKLLAGAEAELRKLGCRDSDITRVSVPGAFELPAAAGRAVRTGKFDAVIGLGCVLRGETSHYELVAGEAAQGLGWVGRHADIPVAFGVLTCETNEQALERAGGKEGNKGAEAARAAVDMISVYEQLTRIV